MVRCVPGLQCPARDFNYSCRTDTSINYKTSTSFSSGGKFSVGQQVGAGCWVLGAGCWVLGAGCWVLGAGCWVLRAGCWVLGAGCWVLRAGCHALVNTRFRASPAQRRPAGAPSVLRQRRAHA
jgi:hypothetical protein